MKSTKPLSEASTYREWPFKICRRFDNEPVVNCMEAARARGVRLAQELKTIILTLPHGPTAAHVPGDARLATKAVKRLLRVKDARFATVEELERLGLERGRINPSHTQGFSVNLLCLSLFDNAEVTTNDGSFTGGVAFSPIRLLQLPGSVIGRFSHHDR